MFLASNQHISMISEGSCDTEDWSNEDFENAALHHRNKLYIKIYYNRKQLSKIIFHFTVFCSLFMLTVSVNQPMDGCLSLLM